MGRKIIKHVIENMFIRLKTFFINGQLWENMLGTKNGSCNLICSFLYEIQPIFSF